MPIKGFVTDKLRQLIENGTRIDLVVAVGPIVMMKAIAELTRKENIRTVVSLNPIMIDGTGMCGGCRVLIDGKSEFACVDGPEFDAHQRRFRCAGAAQLRCTAKAEQSRWTTSAALTGTQGVTKTRAPIAPGAREGESGEQKITKLRNLPMKERMKVPRQLMPEQAADERSTISAKSISATARNWRSRRHCAAWSAPSPPAPMNCPVGVKVKEFVELIVAGDFLGAAAKIREDNVLPAVTGRVCPQEDHCEGKCLLSKKVKPLGIGYLERFVADYEQRMGSHVLPSVPPTGKKVAVVGSGPSGLTVAGDLIQKGHKVRVFEALHEIGGVLVYGIPEFRLPKHIIRQQIDYMRKMGVEFETDVVVGRTVTDRRTPARRRIRRGLHRHRRRTCRSSWASPASTSMAFTRPTNSLRAST